MSEEEQNAITEEELRKYQQAIEQEYERAEAKAKTVDETVENSVEFFRKNAAHAGATIVFLMEHSTSDSVRLGAAKYVIDRVMRGQVDAPGDPVAEILKGLATK